MGSGWETVSDLRDAFAEAKANVTPRQLERWRNLGLMPPIRQVGRGRTKGGSDVLFPAGSAEQAIEIYRLLAATRKLEGIGWRLWMKGYPVAEHHWRQPLESVFDDLRNLRATVRQHRDGEDVSDISLGDTVYDQIDITDFRSLPIFKHILKIEKDRRASLFRIAADVLLGSIDSEEILSTDIFETILETLGVPENMPMFLGLSLNFDPLKRVMIDLSETFCLMDGSNKLPAEPSLEVRRELSNAIFIASELHRSLSWIFEGHTGLRMVEQIISKQAHSGEAIMLLVWDRFRGIATNLESSAAIDVMAKSAACLREISEAARNVVSTLFPTDDQGQIAKKTRRAIADPKTLRAFGNSLPKLAG